MHRALPDGIAGYYSHDRKKIYIDPRLSAGQYRSTLAHEMIHAERGDVRLPDAWLNAKQEMLVEIEAAKRLISFRDIIDAARWCRSLWELADHLIVDEQMMLTRLTMLTEQQRSQLREAGEGWWSI